MEENNNQENQNKKVKNWGTGGGMYRSVKVSVKTLNYVIGILMVVLVGVIIFLASTSHYVVDFEMNGGESISSYKCKYGDYVQFETPSKTGYTFNGWFADSDLTKSWDEEKDIVEKSMTLYASWVANDIKIMFDLDGGTINQQKTLDPIVIPFNESYGELPTPLKTGYVFKGWQYNGTFIDNNMKVSMNGEHTLKAIWQ